MRLDKILSEYDGRVRLRERAFPLEVFGGGPPIRDELEVEKWLAALQEPSAEFHAYDGKDYPVTTLPAFEAAWCAFQQGDHVGHDYDLRVRRAFFAQSRNIERREVLFEIAQEAGIDMNRFSQQFDSGTARQHVIEDGQLGREQYRVHGTPTIMLSDGTKLHHPMAYPKMENGRILQVGILPCRGDECIEITRGFFEKALQQVAELRENMK